MAAIEIHLVYASIVWIAAWLITSLDRTSATANYWIWVLTSVNFALPLGLLPARVWPAEAGYFMGGELPSIDVPRIAIAIWIAGTLLMLVRLRRAEARRSTGPAVVGLFRTRIELPNGIERVLTPGELDAVLAHERRHAVRRDNLILLVHELIVCLLWFHPLVWLTRSRLALYRELSCDEAVACRPDLVSALSKLAVTHELSFSHATVSSFVSQRLELLTRVQRRRSTALVVAIFAVIFIAAAAAPVAQTCAEAACRAVH